MTSIIALNAFNDNYIWTIHSPDSAKIIVVDPGEAEPVLSYIKKYQPTLAGILLTHHHFDHSGGIISLLDKYPSIPVYSSKIDQVPGVTHTVQEGETIHFSHLTKPIYVLDIPAHTLGHIAFLYDNVVFSGDTLFSVGAGKIFEGTVAQMYHSLNKLKNLPRNTLLYCGHEYTLANIAFAQIVDPDNPILEQRRKEVQALRAHNLPSLPVSLEIECQTNPFLRSNTPVIIEAVQKHAKKILTDPIQVLLELRQWKNHFAS